jgi:hypothetical protein
MSRIGRLVIPAMGARNTRFLRIREPMATVFCIELTFLFCLKNKHTSNKKLKMQGVFHGDSGLASGENREMKKAGKMGKSPRPQGEG